VNEFVYSLILFVLALGMAVTLLGTRQSPLVPFGLAMPQWAAAVAVTPLGLVLLSLGREFAQPWFSLLGKAMIAAGYALFVGALLRAVGVRCTRRLRILVFLPALIVLLASAFYLAIDPTQPLRTGLLSLVLSGYSFAAVALALSDLRRGSRFTLFMLSGGFALAGIVQLVRGIWLSGDPALYATHALLERALLSIGVLAPLGSTVAFALTASNRLQAEFAHLAHRDELTGLPNRRAFVRQAQRLFTGARPHRLAALVIDIDHFKQVNDRLGHPEGDRILVRVAGTLASCIDPGDLLARVGGEEFYCLLPGADLREAERLSETMRQKVEVTFAEEKRAEARVTISVGAAVYREFDEHLQMLLERADRALLAAKALGRNRVVTDAQPLRTAAVPGKIVDLRQPSRPG
jgi:diguanylate cyclase (GGDEF)-like protein